MPTLNGKRVRKMSNNILVETSEWKQYVEHDGKIINYKCEFCKRGSGRMYRRFVTEKSGETRKEYKITCSICGRSTGLHYHKRLTRQIWDALGEKE